MREISFLQIVQRVEWLYHRAAIWLSPDIVMGLECAAEGEEDPAVRSALEDRVAEVLRSAEMGTALLPGKTWPRVIAHVGRDVQMIGGSLDSAIAEGLRRASGDGSSSGRLALIAGERIYLQIVLEAPEEALIFGRLSSAAAQADLCDFVIESAKRAALPAPWPLIVGIGLGDSESQCAQLAAEALARPIDRRNEDPYHAKMERRILRAMNGPDGSAKALAVQIEARPRTEACYLALRFSSFLLRRAACSI